MNTRAGFIFKVAVYVYTRAAIGRPSTKNENVFFVRNDVALKTKRNDDIPKNDRRPK